MSAGLALGALALLAAPFPSSIGGCETAPGERPAYYCLQHLARSGPAERAAVERRLRARLSRDAHDREARLALGLLLNDGGDARAEGLLRGAATDMRAARDSGGEADAWRAMVPVLITRRQLEWADEAAAAAAAAASGDHLRTLAVRVTEARLCLARNRYDRALAALDAVQPEIDASEATWLQSGAAGARGGALLGLGRERDAEAAFRRQLEMVRARGDRYDEADTLFALALAIGRRTITREAMALSEQALAAALASGNAWAEATVSMSLAQDTKRPLPERIDLIRRALVVLRRTGDVGNTCFALRELARCLSQQPGQQEAAFHALDEAVDLARQADDRFHLARGLLRRWTMTSVFRGRAAALSASSDALDAIEGLRGLQTDAEARARVLGQWAFVYQQVLGYHLSPAAAADAPAGVMASAADLDHAFQVTERLRAQELLAGLDATGATAALPPSPRGAHLVTIGEVQAALAPDQALLSFVVCQRTDRMPFERPWVFVLTRDAAEALPLPAESNDAASAVAALDGLVARRDGGEEDGAVRLHHVFLGEALARLPASVTRLVLVPDGALHRLPFDGLRPAPGAPPLGDRFEVTVVPSASLWLRLRGLAGPGGRDVLALADPRFAAVAGTDTERQALPWPGLQLGALPRGRGEAESARRALGTGRVLTGAAASERALKAAHRTYGVLHLAAHAVVDDQEPRRSAIVLAPGAPEEDGLLQAREIVGLDLGGALVVLSACSSSSGEVLAGEGPLTLARSFLQAGARAVVGNLWEVRDDEAEALMGAFYRQLGQGRTVAAALAAARRERARAGAPLAAWAGTVVIGDGDATLAPGPASRPAAGPGRAATAAAIVVGLLLLAVLVRRRR